MAPPIWKGHISFGLVHIPVVLQSAEKRSDIRFHMIDSRNSARVRYERVNEVTGAEVPWDKIVKGYEYDGGNYVVLNEKEMELALPELTKTIEIEQFVDPAQIDVLYYDRPYYVLPGKGGEKGYVLLREAMAASGRVGIARVVIRARGYVAALIPQDDALVLEMLRFQQEVRGADDYEFPTGSLSDYKVTKRELELAGRLIEGMAGDWDPGSYHDEYRNALMELIERRIKSGATTAPDEDELVEPKESPRTLNFMDVLKESLSKSAKPATTAKKKKAAPRKTSTRKKRTG